MGLDLPAIEGPGDMTIRNEATQRQVDAARPDRSTWLAANAGSGKTRVLTDRVARLLLEGVSPEHILCLTYTKAAASEMQNRLFKRLGDWAMKPDAELRSALEDLGLARDIDAKGLRKARTLFASAIETPGGLKIQTIHSFCASILRRFPLESRVSPQFREMEDRAAALLRAQIVDDMSSGSEVDLVAGIARHLSDMDFESITSEIARNRDAFSPAVTQDALRALFDLPAGAGATHPLSIAFDGTEPVLFSECIPVLREHSQTMVKLADTLAQIDTDTPNLSDLETLFEFFLYRKDGRTLPEAKTKSVPTKKAADALGSALFALHDFMERVARARDAQLALAAFEKTAALHDFAAAFLPRYEAAKLVRGWLDFDDLIHKTLELLTDKQVADWVLYRLDGGIDHILVDEAQDTSPIQWQVIEKLAREFTSGEGARSDVLRTIFVVGDKKQSIYSFQGADPSEFDRMKKDFAARLTSAGAPLQDLTLQFSFRSAEAILRIVDTVFEDKSRSGFSQEELHRAFKSDMPGRVDLWPWVEPSETADKGAWDEPVDLLSDAHHNVVLAERIAGQITRMLRDRVALPDGDGRSARPVRPGDFLILVRRRSDLFAEIIRACKQAGLPIAGADRLKVGAEIAVRDIQALLSWLALPEDDLSLAIVLKSPFFGWDEQRLYDLAQGRVQKYLWRELAARQAEFADVWAMLSDLRDSSDFLRPYDLIERALTRHGGRKALLARLGHEAEDGINALLSQALAYEQTEIPNLTGFLSWMDTEDIEVKRQMDSAGDQIRVMTVHGAKGLEAPIVILPDCARLDVRVGDALLPMGEHLVWKSAQADNPRCISDALDAAKIRQQQERDRLLYVAMTRAENWLIVAAAGDLGSDGQSWYQTVDRAMQACNAAPLDHGFGAGLRHASGDWPATPDTPARQAGGGGSPDIPAWAHTPAPAPRPEEATLRPSDLGGAKALPGEAGQDEDAAKRYGTLVHTALERLAEHPPDARTADIGNPVTAMAHAEARAVLDDPDLSALFADGSFAEVAVTALLPDGRRMHGIIDRLVVRESSVLAVDFKSNAVLPEHPEQIPEGVLRQLGAYAVALGQVYPDRRIDTALLWTKSARLMHVPHDLVTAALARTTSP